MLNLKNTTNLYYELEPHHSIPSRCFIDCQWGREFRTYECCFGGKYTRNKDLDKFRENVGWDNARRIASGETVAHTFELYRNLDTNEVRFFIYDHLRYSATYASIWKNENRLRYFQILLRGA